MFDAKRGQDKNSVTPIITRKDKTSTGKPTLSDISDRDKPWRVHRNESEQIEAHYQGTEFQKYATRIHFCSEFLDFVFAPGKTEGELRLKLQSIPRISKYF